MSYCAGVWTGVCLRGAWMVALVSSVSRSEWDLPSQQHLVDALPGGMRTGPFELPEEVQPIEKFV